MAAGAEADRLAATTDPPAHRLARRALAAFVLTFCAARILVLLIMTRRMPDLFLHVGRTHVHHLNYGIVLLAAVGGWLLFARPRGRVLLHAAVAYGIGLALTFDEFGMWLHLGGGYWQRVSYDAVIVIASLIGLVSVGPSIARLRTVHVTTGLLIAMVVAAFGWLLVESLDYVDEETPRLEQLEEAGPR